MATAPISLYLDLERGQKADLETVARASLAFAAAIRDIAFVLDPSVEIRIELASGTESSLSLNALVKDIGKKVHDPKYLASIVVGVMAYFGAELAEWTTFKVFDWVADDQPTATLSDADIKKIAETAATIIEKKIGAQHVQQVYREIETDPAIKGVGATNEPGSRPPALVPREQFGNRIGLPVVVVADEIGARRITPSQVTITLIKPVLKRGKRHWRFMTSHGEIGATMDDETFVENVLSGNVTLPMVEGIEFRVSLNTQEEFTADKVWKPIGYSIEKVWTFRTPPIQERMNFGSMSATQLNADEDDPDDKE